MRQLKHLLAVAKTGNYARAADAVGITQSALSQSIARFEEELGVKLLERGRFGATLTEAGQLLLPRARLIEAEERLARSELQSFKDATRGDVAIGVGKSLVQYLIPEAIRRFSRQRPGVVITAYEGWSPDMFRRLLLGELDFVVSAALPQLEIDPDLKQDLLFVQHEVVVAGADHPLAREEAPALKNLVNQQWVVPPPGNGRVRHLQSVFQRAGLEPPSRFIRTDSVALLSALVRQGPAIGLATVELLAGEAVSGLQQLAIPELTEERRACLTYRRRSPMRPLAKSLANEVRQVAVRPDAMAN